MASRSGDMADRPDQAGKRPKPGRMNPDERERHFVEEAIRFFAEEGFGGGTRDLARRLGVTQPLLYRYFPSKERLIERVYEEVYLRRWDPSWEALVADRRLPLEERLSRFYREYAAAIYDYDWVRIFVFSGLKDGALNARYLAVVRDRVLRPVCAELRHAHALPGPEAVPISDGELELAWGLHGMFFYRALRRFVYQMPMVEDLDAAIENEVRMFLAGAPGVQRRIVTAAGPPVRDDRSG